MTPGPSSGLLVVDKPGGMTSHDVVARVRRLAGTRKVGHAGTLDPMATGVLLLGLNRGTRLLGHLALSDKSYDATVRLGVSTTTDDAEGETVAVADASSVDEAAVRGAAARFVGEIDQVPSSVSAVKVGGRRAYARVRAGEDVVLQPRRVTVEDLTVRDVRRAGQCLHVDLSVRCSTGTYVRALARDIGSALGVGGHLTALRRTSVGPVTSAEAATLPELDRAAALVLEGKQPATDPGGLPLMSLEAAAQRFFPTVAVDSDQARDVAYGRPLDVALAEGVVAVLGPDGRFLALYRAVDVPSGSEQRARSRPVAVFV